MREKIAAASALNVVEMVVNLASVLAVSPVLITHFGKAGYGFWVFLLTFLRYLELVDFGLSNAATRYLSRLSGVENAGAYRWYFGFFRKAFLWLSLLVVSLAGIAALLVPVFVEDMARAREARIVIGAGGGLMALGFFLRPFAALLRSRLEYRPIILARTLRVVLFSGLILLCLSAETTLIDLLKFWLVALVVEQGLITWRAWPFIPKAQADYNPPPGARREILQYGGKQFTAVLANFFRSRIDVPILGALVSTVAVTDYSVGRRFIIMFSDFVNALFGSHFLAGFSKLESSGDREAATGRLLQTLKVSSILGIVGAVGILLVGPPFIDRWLGAGFERSHQVIYWLAVPTALMLMQYPTGPFLGSINKHGRMAVLSIAGGVLNAAFSIILVLKVGFIGVVVATAVELTLSSLVIRPWILKSVGVDLGSYLAAVFGPIPRLTPAILISWWLAADVIRPRGYPALIGAAALVCFLIFLNGWWSVLDGAERRKLVSIVGKRVKGE